MGHYSTCLIDTLSLDVTTGALEGHDLLPPEKKTVNPETDNFRVKNFSGQNWVNDII